MIITQLQFNPNNSFSIIMQLLYNYTHDVMLTSLIVIHLLNLTHDNVKIFKHKIDFLFEILISIIHYDC